MSTLPPVHAPAARLRVLKKRAAQSHLPLRSEVAAVSIADPYDSARFVDSGAASVENDGRHTPSRPALSRAPDPEGYPMRKVLLLVLAVLLTAIASWAGDTV